MAQSYMITCLCIPEGIGQGMHGGTGQHVLKKVHCSEWCPACHVHTRIGFGVEWYYSDHGFGVAWYY